MSDSFQLTREAHPWLRRLAWIGVLLTGIVAYLVLLFVVTVTHYPNFVPALLLVGAITPPMTMLVYAEGGARALPVPLWSVVLTATVGGLVGFIIAGLMEDGASRQLGNPPMVVIATIEEAAKLLVPAVLLLAWRPQDTRGGVVIGVAAGMGFGTLETLGYGYQALQGTRHLAEVDSTLLLRGLVSPASHIAWTGVTVAMLWRIRSSQHRVRAVGMFLLTYVVAVFLHTLWDTIKLIGVQDAIAAFSFVVLMVFILRSHRHAARLHASPQHPPAGERPPDLPRYTS